MTLQASGQISMLNVAQELAMPLPSTLDLGNTQVRTLAGKATGAISLNDLHGKTLAVPQIRVYYGLSNVANATDSMVLGLPSLDIVALPTPFSLNAGASQFMYWASPVTLGAVKFYDTDSFFTGGWDGAKNDPFSLFGPITLSINSVPYYVYRTDYANLGLINWEARVDLSPNY